MRDLARQRLENLVNLCTLYECIFYVCFAAAIVKSATHEIKEHLSIKSLKVLISNAFFPVGQLRAPVNLVRRSRQRILLVELGVIVIETFCSR